MASPASLTDVVSIIHGIYQVCQDVSSSKRVVKATGGKLMTMVPLLQQLHREDTTHVQTMVDSIHHDLAKLQDIIYKATTMNRVVFVVKATSIHDDIDTLLQQVNFSFNSLVVSQGFTIQSDLQRFRSQWTKDMKELADIRKEEVKERQQLMQKGTLVRMAGGSKRNIQLTQQAMKEEQEELQRVLLESNEDTVRLSKLRQESAFMAQIIASLATAEEDSQEDAADLTPQGRRGPPEWAICPITHEVMTDPVTVDSPCQHTFSRSAINEWLGRGKTTCPIDGLPLRSNSVAPQAHLRGAIEEFLASSSITSGTGGSGFTPNTSTTRGADPPAYDQTGQESIIQNDVNSRYLAGGYSAATTTVRTFGDADRLESGTMLEEFLASTSNTSNTSGVVGGLDSSANASANASSKQSASLSLVSQEQQQPPTIGKPETQTLGGVPTMVSSTSEVESNSAAAANQKWCFCALVVAIIAAVAVAVVVLVMQGGTESTAANPRPTPNPTTVELFGVGYDEAFTSRIGRRGLTESIPTTIGLLTALTYLDLGWNDITGTIPSEIGLLTALNRLVLTKNQMTGEIPSEIGMLTALTLLTLSNNQFSGEIPTDLGSLLRMEYLYLYNNTQLSGTMPSSLCSNSNLFGIRVDCPAVTCTCTACACGAPTQ